MRPPRTGNPPPESRDWNTNLLTITCAVLAGLTIAYLLVNNPTDQHRDTSAQAPQTETTARADPAQWTGPRAPAGPQDQAAQTGTAPHTLTISPAAKPQERPQDPRTTMLTLTNQHRASHGLQPVRLGGNPAAQRHAQSVLEGCYLSHWDQWGLTPNHRYALAGGTGADGENVSGASFCPKTTTRSLLLQRPADPHQEAAQAVEAWMNSPGHRRNLLNPAHTLMHAGIASNRSNTVMVQQFASDYVHYHQPPNISSQGLLTLSGTLRNATLQTGDLALVTLGWEPPPQPLTRGQLVHTYSVCNPVTIAYIASPPPRGMTFHSPKVTQASEPASCLHPRRNSPDTPAPQSYREAQEAWKHAKQASQNAPWTATAVRRIVAQDTINPAPDTFQVAADITHLLNQHGPGIYTVMLWGLPRHMQEPALISQQPIFWLSQPTTGHPHTAP